MAVVMKKIVSMFCLLLLLGGCSGRAMSPVEMANNKMASNPTAAGESLVFYVDPINGSMDNTGTSDSPWSTLEDVIKNKLIKTQDQYGAVINPDGLVQAGDTIILRSGFHGHVQIRSAFNEKPITVKSEQGANATLAELELLGVKNWKFSGLAISPSFSSKAIRTRYIVLIGDSGYFGKTSDVELSDSHIFSSSKNPEMLSKEEWKNAKYGVLMGRQAKKIIVRNNFIQSTSFGIYASSPESIVEGNVVTDFSKDGIRILSSATIVKYNVVKNNYAVDRNHDDGIQGFSYNGVDLTSSTIQGNIVLNRDKIGNSFPGSMQGIGLFDGPFYNFLIQDNVVMSFTWHGVSIYDSVGGKIQSNFVYTPKEVGGNVGTRITLGTKNKGVEIENLLSGNVAHQYVLNDNDFLEGISNLDIDKMPGDSETLFMKKLKTMLNFINGTYGETHEISNRKRINEDFLLQGPSILFN